MRGKGKKPKISCKERMAFLMQRWGAKKRGIPFYFTYDDWLAWWIHQLGPDWFELRGTRRGQYVMARYGDVGPYAVDNVRCATMEENCKEALHGKNRRNAKLGEAQVKDIYLEVRSGPRGTISRLARQHNVNERTISDIKTKMTWDHVTDLLD